MLTVPLAMAATVFSLFAAPVADDQLARRIDSPGTARRRLAHKARRSIAGAGVS